MQQAAGNYSPTMPRSFRAADDLPIFHDEVDFPQRFGVIEGFAGLAMKG
jgi:hypothetical protein